MNSRLHGWLMRGVEMMKKEEVLYGWLLPILATIFLLVTVYVEGRVIEWLSRWLGKAALTPMLCFVLMCFGGIFGFIFGYAAGQEEEREYWRKREEGH